jgi:hypothetical protein
MQLQTVDKSSNASVSISNDQVSSWVFGCVQSREYSVALSVFGCRSLEVLVHALTLVPVCTDPSPSPSLKVPCATLLRHMTWLTHGVSTMFPNRALCTALLLYCSTALQLHCSTALLLHCSAVLWHCVLTTKPLVEFALTVVMGTTTGPQPAASTEQPRRKGSLNRTDMSCYCV